MWVNRTPVSYLKSQGETLEGNSEVFVANVVTVGSDKTHVTPTVTNSLLTVTSLYNTSSCKGNKHMNLSPNK